MAMCAASLCACSISLGFFVIFPFFISASAFSFFFGRYSAKECEPARFCVPYILTSFIFIPSTRQFSWRTHFYVESFCITCICTVQRAFIWWELHDDNDDILCVSMECPLHPSCVLCVYAITVLASTDTHVHFFLDIGHWKMYLARNCADTRIQFKCQTFIDDEKKMVRFALHNQSVVYSLHT